MCKFFLPVITAVSFFIIGTAVVSIQLWYLAKTEAFTGAVAAERRVNSVLDEARHASNIARDVALKGCTQEGQYQLGTEIALQSHLRTILVLKQGELWCSSLPGNHKLISHITEIPDTTLFLVPAKNTVNGQPVLLYQVPFPGGRIVISISNRDIGDALRSPINEVNYSLVVENPVPEGTGNSAAASQEEDAFGTLHSERYPFTVRYNLPALFNLKRTVEQGSGILIFIFLMACAAGYTLAHYFNRGTTPEKMLRKAVIKGEIVPFYQPVVDGHEETLRGVEVLARWKHPDAGYISPESFIPVAEQSGLIIPLTQKLMAQVVEHMNIIADKLPEGFHVGINFSASHITSPSFVEECLKYKAGFSRKDLNLVIEVTEREPLHVDEHLIQVLNILHENGFVIALDDFGTGYSGLSYLHELHIDYIKIDKSFVGRVSAAEESTRLLDCVLDLARKLSLSIVAEGVETKAQFDYLNRNNITFLQGYYFFRPVNFVDLIKILLSKPKVRVAIK